MFRGPLILLVWTSGFGLLLWVSKPKWAALFALGGRLHDMHSLRFTSGATPADIMAASIAAVGSLLSEF